MMEVPSQYFCPLAKTIMEEPVVISSGITYEKKAIEAWLKENNVDPTTHEALENKIFFKNIFVKKMISEFLENQKKHKREENPNAFQKNKRPKFLTEFFETPKSEEKQNIQNSFILALSKNDKDGIQECIAKGASFCEPDESGVYPLMAAMYSISWEAVELIEINLPDAKKQEEWSRINKNDALKAINNSMPEQIPSEGADYDWLSQWYKKNENKTWCKYFDLKCRDLMKRDLSWFPWDYRSKMLYLLKESIEDEGFLQWHTDKDVSGIKHLHIPPKSVLVKVIGEIRDHLKELKQKVEANSLNNNFNDKEISNYSLKIA